MSVIYAYQGQFVATRPLERRIGGLSPVVMFSSLIVCGAHSYTVKNGIDKAINSSSDCSPADSEGEVVKFPLAGPRCWASQLF